MIAASAAILAASLGSVPRNHLFHHVTPKQQIVDPAFRRGARANFASRCSAG
jgi:hypothetical protein